MAWILPVFWVAGAVIFVAAGGLSSRRLHVWGGTLRVSRQAYQGVDRPREVEDRGLGA